MKTLLLSLSIVIVSTSFAQVKDKRVRTVFVEKDQIVRVNTSLGIASIVSVPDKPSSVVLGDTEAFKVEYLDQAITIKPLHEGAESNLYVFTDYQRFNVHLVTGSLASADYVVYLKGRSRKEPDASVSWLPFGKSIQSGDLLVSIERLGRKTDGSYLMVCVLSSRKKMEVNPQWFHLIQGNRTIPIEQVYLSSKTVDRKTAVQVVMLLRRESVKSRLPLKMVLERKPLAFVDLPKGESWK